MSGKAFTDCYVVRAVCARSKGARVPAWFARSAAQSRLRHSAVLVHCGLESLTALLLVERPTAFRRRMISVGDEPLYRPRRDSGGTGQ